MWVQADADGNIARDEVGQPVSADGGMPTCFVDPPVTKKRRRTDTGVRDDFVVHFTGRTGRQNPDLPAALRGIPAPRRLFRILRDLALLALAPFGRYSSYPAVCFCEGDEDARARLMTGNRYQPYGIAFHRGAVEAWGARPTIYTDADIIELLYDALYEYWRNHRDEFDKKAERRLDVARALLMRDWPGSEEPLEYFQEHNLSFELMNANEWSHEHEMRLIMPAHSWRSPSCFYWLFERDAVAHLLWPAGHDADIGGFAAAVADDPHVGWALEVEIRRVGPDGLPTESQPLRSYLP